MLHSFLLMQSTYCAILSILKVFYFEEFPKSRENICPGGQAKFYVILKVIPLDVV